MACRCVATRTLAGCPGVVLRRSVLAAPARQRCFGSFQVSEEQLERVRGSKPWPPWLRGEMRSNWAGETGAVEIYRGCKAALERVACAEQRAALAAFVDEHVAAEEAHLAAMAAVVTEPSERSWMPAASFGWCLGFASTALRGARGMYVTTHAVEHFVEEHYGDQIARLGRELGAGERSPREAYEELQALLRAACADEVGHKEDAAQRAAALMGATGDGASGPGVTDRMHFAFVYWGSRVGAAVAKRL